MPNRMLRYFNDINIAYPDETIYQYLLYIGKEPLSMCDNITNAHLYYRYTMIDMHDVDYRFFMQQNSADALVLAVLCDFRNDDPKTVVHEILTRLIALSANDSKMLREYVMMLEVLASNRDLNINIQQEFEMLEVEIEKLPSYLMGEKRGIEKGIDQGIELGEHRKGVIVASQLIQLNMSLEQVAQISGLSLEEVRELSQAN